MSERYAEWLVKRKTPGYMVFVKAVMIVLCLLAFVSVIIPVMGMFGFLLFLMAAAVTFLIFQRSEVEFEYLYIEKQLSIDQIYGKSKRKTVWDISMDEVQVIAPSDSPVLKNYGASDIKILDFSSQLPQVNTYTLIAGSGAQARKVIFEPNDKIIQCMKMTVPGKLK